LDFYNEFDSYMLELDDSAGGFIKRLLDTTQHLKVPARLSLRFLISSNDVLHSFALLAVGMKVDAVPGRLNAMTIFLLKEGLLRGQCSELCGAGHYGMPIVLESLREDRFEAAMCEDFFRTSLGDNLSLNPLRSHDSFPITESAVKFV
jgi:heme/copper-type cytochrome/quinol oxidase subunit 2